MRSYFKEGFTLCRMGGHMGFTRKSNLLLNAELILKKSKIFTTSHPYKFYN